MSKKPSHRGAAPEDHELYDARHVAKLRAAMADLGWLLDRGYALASSVELVGNRFELTARQRMAVTRCACCYEDLQRRRLRQVEPAALRGEALWLDGFNVLMALEVALAGGVILVGRDGCCRDVAGVHARYHKVEETLPALRLLAETTRDLGARECRWLLDAPVSNSGRLRSLLTETARANAWPWTIELVMNPDKALAETRAIIATSDSAVLNRCARWVNLTRLIIATRVPTARVVDLGQPPTPNP